MEKIIFTLDDSNVIKANLEMILEDAGFKHQHSWDGEEAIENLKALEKENKRISLVFCDINMPKKNGIEFLKWFKNQPQYKLIPVIMMTTETEVSLMQEAKQIGAAGWIIKPFMEEQLLDVIRKFAK